MEKIKKIIGSMKEALKKLGRRRGISECLSIEEEHRLARENLAAWRLDQEIKKAERTNSFRF